MLLASSCRYIQDEAFLTKLDPVVDKLKSDVPDAKYDRKSLAQLLLHLRQFMENVMGKEVCVCVCLCTVHNQHAGSDRLAQNLLRTSSWISALLSF